jgi:hypothetical protein
MDLQTAANFVGEECKKLMNAYFEERIFEYEVMG